MLTLRQETRPRFRIANRSILLFCVSVILVSIGSFDYGSLHDNTGSTGNQNNPSRAVFLTRTPAVNQTAHASSSSWLSPRLFATCGPAQLSGRVGLGNVVSKWLPWSQIRTGTICRHVQFSTPFVNIDDVRLFLAVDRTSSHRNSHLTPIV